MFTLPLNNQSFLDIIPSKEIENTLPIKKPYMREVQNPMAQRIFENTPNMELTSKVFKCLKNDTPKAEGINNILTEILSDHFQAVINFINYIFTEALEDKESGPLLAQHVSTLLSSNLIQLPPRFNRFVTIASALLPKKAMTHSLVLLTALNKLIDNIFSDEELKTVSIALIVELLTPQFSTAKNPPSSSFSEIEIPEKQKTIISALLQGLDEFFKDLSSNMNLRNLCFEFPDYNALHRESIGNQALETSIIDKMNSILRQKGLLNSLSQNSDKTETNNKISLIQDIFMDIFPRSNVSPKEKEAIAYIAALCTSKCAEVLLSPRMMLYLIEMLLNQKVFSLPDSAENNSPNIQKVTAPSINDVNQSDLDPHFSKVLDAHLQHLVLHGARMGTVDISSRMTLIPLLRSVLHLSKGQIGKEAAAYLHKAAQSSDWTETLDSIYNFLYQTSEEKGSFPALKTLYLENDESIEKRREVIEQMLKADVAFEKINVSIKNYLSESTKTAYCWNAFINHSNMLKSLCGNLSNSLYLISQREKLLKMLSSYLIAYTHQALRP